MRNDRTRRRIAATATMLACLGTVGMPAAVASEAAARPERDVELERFLGEAPVVKIEDVGEGITKPQRITLEEDGRTLRAIFKTHDEVSVDPAYTSMAESTFSDRYVYEVAAYRLDRLLGIGLVPVTVLRTIDGVEGAVQFWVEDAISLQQAMDTNVETGDVERFLRRKMAMQVLDSLIYNIDRNPTNILVTPHDDGFHLIDHSRAFRLSKKLPPWGQDWDHPVPEWLAERLIALDEARLTEAFEGLLPKRHVRAALNRRDRIVAVLRGLGRI